MAKKTSTKKKPPKNKGGRPTNQEKNQRDNPDNLIDFPIPDGTPKNETPRQLIVRILEGGVSAADYKQHMLKGHAEVLGVWRTVQSVKNDDGIALTKFLPMLKELTREYLEVDDSEVSVSFDPIATKPMTETA